MEPLLLVAFSRWRIERLFEDSKTELGMDHFEVRKYNSIQRHLILTCVSYLFLDELWLAHRDKRNGTDALPRPDRHTNFGFTVVPQRPLLPEAGRGHRRAIGVNQNRNAAARRSHRKRTLRRLHRIGVYLTEIRRCRWPDSWHCSTNRAPPSETPAD